jgi:hypothetical protein
LRSKSEALKPDIEASQALAYSGFREIFSFSLLRLRVFMPMGNMPLEKLEPKTDSSSTDASMRLFDDACGHLKPAIKFVQAHQAESITAGLVLVSAAVALRGRGLAALGSAGEGVLGKNLLGKSAPVEKILGGVAKQVDTPVLQALAEPVQYRTVAEEVRAFNSTFVSDGAAGANHDAVAHTMIFRNPTTPGGEMRGAFCQSVAEQMILFPGRPPSYDMAINLYQGVREVLRKSYGYKAPPIPEATLKKWFDLSERLMAENIKRWGGVPKSTNYEDLQHLLVRRKWS